MHIGYKMKESNVSEQEIKKFNSFAKHWWDSAGELKSLHDINPLRVKYIDNIVKLKDKTVLDVGCGGGILSESMCKIGAKVSGIDMSTDAIKVAKLHQHESGTKVDYSVTTAEEFAAKNPEKFDVVTCLEMLEHVPDPVSVIKACSELVKPGGHIFFSTLNRNAKSYLFAIVGAEYLLKLIPKNTHDFANFIKPHELSDWAREVNLQPKNSIGITYSPFTKKYKLADDVSVNYMMHFVKNI